MQYRLFIKHRKSRNSGFVFINRSRIDIIIMNKIIKRTGNSSYRS